MSFLKSIVLAAVAIVPLASAQGCYGLQADFVPQAKNSTISIQAAPKYYEGTYDKFPAKSTWKSFDELLSGNKKSMIAAGNTEKDATNLGKAIKSVGKSSGVDPAVILAIIMQESHGYVGVETTYSPEGIPTAGVMQCSGCNGFPGKTGLSVAEITKMVQGGVDHFKGNLESQGGKDGPESVYPALREYNSGSVDKTNLSNGLGATNTYVSDVSQRLGGFTD